MKKKEYDRLKAIDIEPVRKELTERVNDVNDMEIFRSPKMIRKFLTGILLYVKRNPSSREFSIYETKEGLEDPLWYAPDMDDILDVYEEHPDKWTGLMDTGDHFLEEELMAYLLFEDDTDGLDVPQGIENLVLKLLRSDRSKRIADIYSGNYTEFIQALFRGEIGQCDISQDSYATSLYVNMLQYTFHEEHLNFLWEDDDEFNVKDVYDGFFIGDGILKTATVDDTWLSENWPEFPKTAFYLWKEIAEALLATKNNGKVIVFLQGGHLNSKSEQNVRKFLLEQGMVEGVICLPEKTLKGTWINPYLLILSHGNKKVRFLNAGGICTSGRDNGKRFNTISDEQSAEIAALYRDNDSVLLVDRDTIIATDSILTQQRYMDTGMTGNRTITLGECLRGIKRGMSITAAEADQMITDDLSLDRCIAPGNIRNGYIQGFRYYSSPQKRRGDNNASYNDILLTKSGNPFDVAISDNIYIVEGNVYILSVDSNIVNPHYLKCFLQSDAGQRELLKYSTGAKTPIISRNNLKKIQIPLFDEPKQTELNEEAERLDQKLKEAKETLDEIRGMF